MTGSFSSLDGDSICQSIGIPIKSACGLALPFCAAPLRPNKRSFATCHSPFAMVYEDLDDYNSDTNMNNNNNGLDPEE